jgi:hypothetical protein
LHSSSEPRIKRTRLGPAQPVLLPDAARPKRIT